MLTVYATQPTKGRSHAIDFFFFAKQETINTFKTLGSEPSLILMSTQANGCRGHNEYLSFTNVLYQVGMDDGPLGEGYDSPRCIASAYTAISIKTLGDARN